MGMTDPVADLLTRIRNAVTARKDKVDVPHSRLKEGVVDVLIREGFLKEKQVLELDKARRVIRVRLRYGPDGERVISDIRRVSKPGCRVYRGSGEMPKVQGGLGISVLSTSHGVMSDREAKSKGLGGEVLASIW
ncbi:MAG TPA: 30S ribosomal protein S8 [Planctomycetota bacterium]|nr:30S ribosomal protein S8 [Planctomycetota bacterium]